MDLPVEISKPLQLHHVQLVNRDAADFRPGAVLEGVIIKKFAAQEQ